MTWRATLAACRLVAMTEAEAKDDALIAAAKSLPLPDRLLHAHWRVRSDAYADVVKEAGWRWTATRTRWTQAWRPWWPSSAKRTRSTPKGACLTVAVATV